MALVAVVLQANRKVMPHERFLTMGHVVVLEQREMKRKSDARTMMDGVGSHARLSLAFLSISLFKKNVEETLLTN